MDQESIIQASSLVLKDEGKSDTKGIFHVKMDSIKDRNGMDLMAWSKCQFIMRVSLDTRLSPESN